MKKVLIILAFLALMIVCIYWLTYNLSDDRQQASTEPIIIGFSLGTTREERWFTDRDLFVARAEELGAVVNVALSDYNAALQSSQIENLASQGARVIVIVPSDSEAIAEAVENVKTQGVKIISYDRLIKNTLVDFYISYDNAKIGELQAASVVSIASSGNFAYLGGSPADNNSSLLKQGAMNVLNPKIVKGDITLVIDEFMKDWKSDEAYKTIKNYLAGGGKLDAIIAANDELAFGAILALKEKNLAGKIPVSGQNADTAACQRIFFGTQTSTVYKPINSIANQAAEIAIAMANGGVAITNGTIFNGLADIPSFFLEPTLVTKKNMMGTIIKDGFHTYEEVYKSGVK